MKGALATILAICLLQHPLHAQLPARPATELTALLQTELPDTMRVKALLQLVLYYYFDHNEVKPDDRKMLFYLQQAQLANQGPHSAKWQNELDCYWGKYFLLTGNREKGNKYFEKIRASIAGSGELTTQIKNWRIFCDCLRELDTAGITQSSCYIELKALFQKNKDEEGVIEMEKAIADTHLKQGKLDAAEKELLAVLERYKTIGYKKLHYTYMLLSSVYSFKGNYNSALYYALRTIESIRNTNDTAGIVNFYCHIAYMYDELGQEEKSAEYFNIAFARPFTNPIDFYNVRAAGMYTQVLIKQNKQQEALSFIQQFAKKYPPAETYGKASLARTFASVYRSTGNNQASEKYIQQMIAISPLLLKNNEITEDVAYDLGRYFLEKNDFIAASGYFKHALDEAVYANCALRKKDIYLMMFKTDSSLGHYAAAIKHLNNYNRLDDSIFTVAKNRQVQEVQTQYETEKKDKDLSLKDKNIQLLTKQSQLQASNLQREKNTRNTVLVCTGLLCLLLALGYNRYKLKQKNNLQLEEQQKKISEKNMHLQHLLEEKEWLVKEIHHRVKNNFHIVMGLLGTQSGYLRNEEAIEAMAESQQRIQAMSLIHQKLYQSENMSDIDMKDYVHELVDYLKSSLNAGRRIQFHFDVERISLGVTHAVPIGLVLNEAITNAVKYAFPDNREGNIYISFVANNSNENNLSLVVTDDGVGLPTEFYKRNNKTMGMNLMNGLARDIDGQFKIESNGGTTVSVVFTCLHYIAEEPIHFVTGSNRVV